MSAQEKLTFLLSLVPFLVERERVSVTDVAEHFRVDPAQIREAVQLIAMSGVPGSTTTYQYEDLFDINWDDFELNDQIVLTNLVALDDSPRFSAREAAALLAGLQYLSSLPENADREAVSTLMAKLSRGASELPSQLAVEVGESDLTLALVRESVAGGVQLEFDYLGSRGERERRRIDPLRVESMDADWYLRGWDHAREAVRTFRLDRISAPSVTTQPILHRAGDVTLPRRPGRHRRCRRNRRRPARRLHPRQRRARAARRRGTHHRARGALPRPQEARGRDAGGRDGRGARGCAPCGRGVGRGRRRALRGGGRMIAWWGWLLIWTGLVLALLGVLVWIGWRLVRQFLALLADLGDLADKTALLEAATTPADERPQNAVLAGYAETRQAFGRRWERRSKMKHIRRLDRLQRAKLLTSAPITLKEWP
jgi:proteasome accessory factor C